MQLVPELGDLLPARHRLLLLHQDVLVVRVDRDVALVVLDHHQLAQPRDAAADVGHAPRRRGGDRVARTALDIDALLARLGEAGDELALDRPGERERAGFELGFFLFLDYGLLLGRTERPRFDAVALAPRADHHRGLGRRLDAQHLPDADLARIVEGIPLRDFAVVVAMLERDAVERVALLHHVETVGRGARARHGRGRLGGRRRFRHVARRGPTVLDRRLPAARAAAGGERERENGEDCFHALPASIGTKRTASSSDSMKPRPLRSTSSSRCAPPELSGRTILPPGASWRRSASGTSRGAAARMIEWNGAAFSSPA